MIAIAKRTEAFSETEIDDEVVLMKLDSGEFFSITGTGRAIWAMIDGRRDRAAVVAALAAQFDAPEAEIAADADEFLDQLTGEGLLAAG